MSGERLLLGVDGGNSKTHLALARSDGSLLAAVAGPTISHQQIGLRRGVARLVALRDAALAVAGLSEGTMVDDVVLCVAGADFTRDVRRIGAAVERAGIARRHRVLNDAFAPLRAGAPRGWGIAVICGAGVNCAGIAPDGRTAAFPALGDISGDWGGGSGIGMAALQAAVRARDGRGPRTALESTVPAFFRLRRPLDVTLALYRGTVANDALRGLAPVVFETAAQGDAVARGILDKLGDELAVMATAIIRRLHLVRRDPDVVLAGGLFGAGDPLLVKRIAAGIRAVAPRASVRALDRPPVLGALLLALDADGATTDAESRLRASVLDLVPVRIP